MWKEKNPKIKHSILCNEHENGGLKMLSFFEKFSGYNALG